MSIQVALRRSQTVEVELSGIRTVDAPVESDILVGGNNTGIDPQLREAMRTGTVLTALIKDDPSKKWRAVSAWTANLASPREVLSGVFSDIEERHPRRYRWLGASAKPGAYAGPFFTQIQLLEAESQTAPGQLEEWLCPVIYEIKTATEPRAWAIDLFAKHTTVSVELAARFVASLQDAIRNQEWDPINNSIGARSLKATSPELAIAFLRATYRWRHKINEWNDFLKRTRQEFDARQLHSDKLLRGL